MYFIPQPLASYLYLGTFVLVYDEELIEENSCSKPLVATECDETGGRRVW